MSNGGEGAKLPITGKAETHSTWSFTRKKLLKERLIGYSFVSQMTIGPNWEIFTLSTNFSLLWLQHMFKFSEIIVFSVHSLESVTLMVSLVLKKPTLPQSDVLFTCDHIGCFDSQFPVHLAKEWPDEALGHTVVPHAITHSGCSMLDCSRLLNCSLRVCINSPMLCLGCS